MALYLQIGACCACHVKGKLLQSEGFGRSYKLKFIAVQCKFGADITLL